MSDNPTKHVLDILLSEAIAGDETAAAWLRSDLARGLCSQAGILQAHLTNRLENAPGSAVQLSEAEWTRITDKYHIGG